MGKYFWYGTLATVAAAVGVYLAADYAGHHPHSFVARVTGLGDDTCPGCECGTDVGAPEEPRLIEDGLPEQPEPVTQCLPPELLDVTTTGPARQVEETGRLAPSVGETVPLVPWSPPQAIIPAVLETEEDPYQIMPRCPDDEPGVPATMPYAGEGERTKSLPSTWRGVRLLDPAAGEGATEETEVTEPAKCAGCTGKKTCPRCDNCPRPVVTVTEPEEQESGAREDTLRSAPRPHTTLKPSQRLLQPQTPDDECRPCKPRLDTTEFRPTDGRRGEFDRIPF